MPWKGRPRTTVDGRQPAKRVKQLPAVDHGPWTVDVFCCLFHFKSGGAELFALLVKDFHGPVADAGDGF